MDRPTAVERGRFQRFMHSRSGTCCFGTNDKDGVPDGILLLDERDC